MTVTQMVSPPGDVPTTPSGIPVIAAEHVGIERAAEFVLSALTEFVDLLVDAADDKNRLDAEALASNATLLAGQARSVVMQLRWQRTTVARFRGHDVHIGGRS
jgi:hypothetical protein